MNTIDKKTVGKQNPSEGKVYLQCLHTSSLTSQEAL